MEDLRLKAMAYREAKENYGTAFRDYFTNQVTELPEDRFWELQAVLRGEVCTFRFGYKRTNGVEQACREFFRKPVADDFGRYASYSLEEAISFAKSWQGWRGRLYQPLFDVVEDRGDDAYGDLLDSLPLAGSDLVGNALAREFGNQQQLDAGVLEGCGGNEQLAKLILHGENYVAMALADAAQEHYATNVEDWPTRDQG
mgnify:FL=1|jgi:hypothetical protein